MPELFSQNVAILWALLTALIAANPMILGLGMALIKPAIPLVSLPRAYVQAGILGLVVTGAYASANRTFDVLIVTAFGVIGWARCAKRCWTCSNHPVIQRCPPHKIRNVKDLLPQRLHSSVGRRMTDAYHDGSALEAEAALSAPHQGVGPHPPRRGAAASLREGLDETLTALRLGVSRLSPLLVILTLGQCRSDHRHATRTIAARTRQGNSREALQLRPSRGVP